MKRGHKILIIGLGALLAVAAGAFVFLHGKRTEIRVSNAQLQQQLAQTFPVERSIFLLLQWQLANPSLQFLPERQRLGLGLDLHLNLRVEGQKKDLGGRVEVETALRYDDTRGAFFLVDPVITKLAVRGVPEEYVLRVQENLREKLAEIFNRRPIYSLNSLDMKQGAARLVLRDVRIEQDEISIVLGL